SAIGHSLSAGCRARAQKIELPIEPFLALRIPLVVNAGSGRRRTIARLTSQGRGSGDLGRSFQTLPIAALRPCVRAPWRADQNRLRVDSAGSNSFRVWLKSFTDRVLYRR